MGCDDGAGNRYLVGRQYGIAQPEPYSGGLLYLR